MFRSRVAPWVLAAGALLVMHGRLPVLCAFAEPDEPRIGLIEDARHASFEVAGLPAPLLERLKGLEPTDPLFTRLFAVSVAAAAGDPPLPAMSGKYRVDGARLVFTPRFPPRPGLTYRAVVRSDPSVLDAGEEKSLAKVERDITIPRAAGTEPGEPAVVERVYPTASLLPQNQLRFYIHFSQPIARGSAYEHLELLDAAGEPLEAPFLELGEELWDPSGRRFTLLLDPGRVKSGLKPREELGPVLEPHRQYTLVVKRTWRDVEGRELQADYRKTFKTGPAVSTRIDVAAWKLAAPSAGTAQPLSAKFPRSLDHAMLERVLAVVDEGGEPVEGGIEIGDAERVWKFTPAAPWRAGGYRLVVDKVLEDSAGNNIARPFEVDEQTPVTPRIAAETVSIPFRVGPRGTAPQAASRPAAK